MISQLFPMHRPIGVILEIVTDKKSVTSIKREPASITSYRSFAWWRCCIAITKRQPRTQKQYQDSADSRGLAGFVRQIYSSTASMHRSGVTDFDRPGGMTTDPHYRSGFDWGKSTFKPASTVNDRPGMTYDNNYGGINSGAEWSNKFNTFSNPDGTYNLTE